MELEGELNDALSDIKELENSSRFLTAQDNRRHREAFERKLAQREIKAKRKTLGTLLWDLEGLMKYVVARQQKSSLELGEFGVSRGLTALDFGKAKKTWEEKLDEIRELEKDDDQLDEATRLCQELTLSFQTEGEEDDGLTFIERRARAIEDQMVRFSSELEILHELESKMGVDQEPIEALPKIERILFKDAGEYWSNLEWGKLREALMDTRELLNIFAELNMNLREWARFILPLVRKINWLQDQEAYVKETYSLELDETKAWKSAVKKLESDIPSAWAKRDEQELNTLVEQVKGAIDKRQQKLATRIFEKSEDMELKPDVSEEAVKKLRLLHNKILKGPEDDAYHQVMTQASSFKAPVRVAGRRATTELGTEYPEHLASAFEGTDARKKREEEEENKPKRRSIVNGLKEAQDHYFKKRGDE